jgi:hypothetical protein
MISLIENPSPSSCTDQSFLRACIASLYIHCWDDAQGACSACIASLYIHCWDDAQGACSACIASLYIHCWDDAQGACSGRAQNSTPRVLATHPAQLSSAAQFPRPTQDRHPRLQVAVLMTFPFAVAESLLIPAPRRIYFSGCDQYTNGEPQAIGTSGRPGYIMNCPLPLASLVLLP